MLELTAPSIHPPKAFRGTGESPGFVEVTRGMRAASAVTHAVAAHKGGGTAAIVAPTSCCRAIRAELQENGIDFGDAETDTLSETSPPRPDRGQGALKLTMSCWSNPAAVDPGGSGRSRSPSVIVALTRGMRTLTWSGLRTAAMAAEPAF